MAAATVGSRQCDCASAAWLGGEGTVFIVNLFLLLALNTVSKKCNQSVMAAEKNNTLWLTNN